MVDTALIELIMPDGEEDVSFDQKVLERARASRLDIGRRVGPEWHRRREQVRATALSPRRASRVVALSCGVDSCSRNMRAKW